MKKIGFLGGTFNPIHYAHLRVALECKQALGLDEMRMMICARPPHRESPGISALQRKKMLELALQDSTELLLDDRELQRDKPSYSVDTLKSLRQEFPDSALFMVIGSDSFQSLDTWYCWEEILELCHIVIAKRPDNSSDETSRMGLKLKTHFVSNIEQGVAEKYGKIIPVAVSQLEISATRIREMIGQNKSCQYLLPDSVLAFIKENLLYQTR